MDRVDVGLWTLGAQTAVLASNMNYANRAVTLRDLGLTATQIVQVFDSDAKANPDGSGFTFESVGSGGFIIGK